jgi:hypothetical protein
MLPLFDYAKNLLERGEATPVLYTADAVGNPPPTIPNGPISFGSDSGSMRLVVLLLAVLIAISLFRK